jgi:hypothetical protein
MLQAYVSNVSLCFRSILQQMLQQQSSKRKRATACEQ